MKLKLLVCVLLACCNVAVFSQEICDNGKDDDADGKIDLWDSECRCTVYPLIKNPSFEKITDCPTSYSQLQYAQDWFQPTGLEGGSTDLYHSCGNCTYRYNNLMGNFPMPVPDGVGFAAFFDIRNWISRGAYKEHLTTCLETPLVKDSQYVFDFYLGFMTPLVAPAANSYYAFSPVNISLFGHPSCSALPYGRLNDTAYKSCPMGTDPAWVELAKMSVAGAAGQWVKVRVEFKTPAPIGALVIGPSCERSPYGGENDWGFYLIDQVLLYRKTPYGLPSISRSGDICSGTLTLSATIGQPLVPVSWQWYKNGIALPGETQATLQLSRSRYGAGDYTARATIDRTTLLSPEAIVTINEAGFALPDTISFCGNSSFLLNPEVSGTDNCPVSYLWQNGSTNKALTISTPGLYWFETDKNGCRKRDFVTVIASVPPVVNLGNDTMLCPGNRLLLQAGPAGLQYQWQNGDTARSLWVTAPGTYHVKVSNNYCSAEDGIIVQYGRSPFIRFSADTILCQAEQKTLRPDIYGSQYLWNTGSTLPDIVVNQPGIYSLQVQNSCGSVEKQVKIVRGDCRFYLPSAFTPNNDGLNDMFGLPYFNFVRTFQMKIFSRWGQLLFETNNPAQRWDGSYKGAPAPAGSYVWMVTYTDWTSQEQFRKGTVTIIR